MTEAIPIFFCVWSTYLHILCPCSSISLYYLFTVLNNSRTLSLFVRITKVIFSSPISLTSLADSSYSIKKHVTGGGSLSEFMKSKLKLIVFALGRDSILENIPISFPACEPFPVAGYVSLFLFNMAFSF